MSEQQFSWPGRRLDDSAHERVAAFLTIDIQRSPAWAQDLMHKITDVKSGTRRSWERRGNAYRLYLSIEGVVIEDQIDPASTPERVPLDEFEAAVRAWIELIA